MKVAMIIWLGMCAVRSKCVLGNCPCTKRAFNLAAEVTINDLNPSPRVRGAKFFVKDKQFRKDVWLRDLYSWRDKKTNKDKFGGVSSTGKYCSGQKCVYVHPWKKIGEKCYDCLLCKACYQVSKNHSEDQKPKVFLFRDDSTYYFVQITSLDNKNDNHLPFSRNASTSHIQLHPNPCQRVQISFHLKHNPVNEVNQKIQFQSHCLLFQSTVKKHEFLSLWQWHWVVSWPLTRFSSSDSLKSRARAKNDGNFPKTSSASLELVFVSKTRIFEQPFSVSFNYPQPAYGSGDSGWSASSVGAQGMGTSGYHVSDSEDFQFHWILNSTWM